MLGDAARQRLRHPRSWLVAIVALALYAWAATMLFRADLAGAGEPPWWLRVGAPPVLYGSLLACLPRVPLWCRIAGTGALSALYGLLAVVTPAVYSLVGPLPVRLTFDQTLWVFAVAPLVQMLCVPLALLPFRDLLRPADRPSRGRVQGRGGASAVTATRTPLLRPEPTPSGMGLGTGSRPGGRERPWGEAPGGRATGPEGPRPAGDAVTPMPTPAGGTPTVPAVAPRGMPESGPSPSRAVPAATVVTAPGRPPAPAPVEERTPGAPPAAVPLPASDAERRPPRAGSLGPAAPVGRDAPAAAQAAVVAPPAPVVGEPKAIPTPERLPVEPRAAERGAGAAPAFAPGPTRGPSPASPREPGAARSAPPATQFATAAPKRGPSAGDRATAGAIAAALGRVGALKVDVQVCEGWLVFAGVSPGVVRDPLVDTALRFLPLLADGPGPRPVTQATLRGPRGAMIVTFLGRLRPGGPTLVVGVRQRGSLALLEILCRRAAADYREPVDTAAGAGPVWHRVDDPDLREAAIPSDVSALSESLGACDRARPSALRGAAGQLVYLFLAPGVDSRPVGRFAHDLAHAMRLDGEPGGLGPFDSVVLRLGTQRLAVRPVSAASGRSAVLVAACEGVVRPGLAARELEKAAARLAAL